MTTQTVDHLTPVQRAWVDALRSGEYRQGRGRLHRKDDTFCCLGVACDLAVKAGVIGTPVLATEAQDDHATWAYGDGATAHLPTRVAEWLGMHTSNGTYGRLKYLTSDNDFGVPFSTIADTIEANADKLFGSEPVE